MSTLLESATNIDDRLHVQDPKAPYRFDKTLHAEGFWARRLAKQRLTLLRRLDASLQRMLEPGEQVECVTWAIEYSLVEACFLGLWHYQLNRRALVFTDRRLLLLQVDSRKRLKELKAEVRYAAIRRVARSSFGYLQLQLRNGRKLTLTGVPRRDRATVRELIERQTGSGAAAPAAGASHAAGKQDLCPHCFAAVPGRPECCPRCRGSFKSAARAGWLSFRMPGLGDLYLGHRSLGALELIGSLGMWTLVGAAALEEAGKQPVRSDLLVTNAIAFAGLFVVMHGLDALVTRRTGAKGLHPARS
jgi:hypothetical protein